MSPFQRMRQSLVDRGMLDAQFRLTPAGHAYAEEIKTRVRALDAAGPAEDAIVWVTRRAA